MILSSMIRMLAPSWRRRVGVYAMIAAILALPIVAMRASPPSGGFTRWVLAYAGSTKGGIGINYSVDDFKRLLAQVDTAGHPVAWMNTGAILLSIYASSGREFSTWIGHNPAVGEDWEIYLDSLNSPGGILDRLDSAVAEISASVPPPTSRLPVAVMVPYPDPDEDTLRLWGATYSLSSDSGRVDAAGRWIEGVRDGFTQRRFAHLSLDGFYWLAESVKSRDSATVHGVAYRVHQLGLRFLWVPYYFAEGLDHWRALGFDEAWLQPNYFFHKDLSRLRVDSAANRALRLGLGVEIEFNRKLVDDSTYSGRLNPYLEMLSATPELRHRSTVLYDGQGTLILLSRRSGRSLRQIYDSLASVLRN